jgi:deoxyribodipyrimidine photolyase-related protein
MPRSAVWVFEDQLSPTLASLREVPDAPVFMVESRTHWNEWPFHKRRIAFLASGMRHFADELRRAGREVHYNSLRDKPYRDSISAIRQFINTTKASRITIAEPSEYHTKVWAKAVLKSVGVEPVFVDNDLFLTDRVDFSRWARSLKSPVMEHFYRRMRIEHDVLIQPCTKRPVGGEWNLDKQNRKPARGTLHVPKPIGFGPDTMTREVIEDVERMFADHPGKLANLDMPVTRADATRALDDFIENRLPLFGDYEDAMLSGEPFMYHSLLSASLNAHLLRPMELVRAAEKAFHDGRAPLNAVEGFIRQIIGWREYVYGIYWSFMPEYRDRNSRGSRLDLPDWFWTGDTDLNCLRQTLAGVVDRAYSHHIQRLMIVCNFATLAALSPQAVNDWFYAMYIDSHDWVVTPNVIGMGMNADGQTMATKPYVSSAAYINRMSDYCKGCRYNPGERIGDDACPFNFLYWTFLKHFRPKLGSNPRMTMVLKNLDKIDAGEMHTMMNQRKRFIDLHVKGRAYVKSAG